MKRLITVVLALVMLLSSAAAADPDPIVGTWYAYIVVPGSPMEQSFPDGDLAVILVTFTESGDIHSLELDYAGMSAKMGGNSIIGKWEKNGSGYTVSILAVGVSDTSIEDGVLGIPLYYPNIFIKFRKMHELNFYTDMYRK